MQIGLLETEDSGAAGPGDNSQPVEFRSELLSRNGEFIAWSLALLLVAVWYLEGWIGFRITALVFLAIFMLLAAMSISLGNWMDRRTYIRLKEQGIEYSNGLRHTHLTWSEINEVQVFPSKWGKKVRVLGEHGYFAFRTLGEVKVQGEVKGRVGFQDGEYILRQILEQSRLHEVAHTANGYYYARG